MEKKICIILGAILIVLLGIYAGLFISLHNTKAEEAKVPFCQAWQNEKGEIFVIIQDEVSSAHAIFEEDGTGEMRGTMEIETLTSEERYTILCSDSGEFIISSGSGEENHGRCYEKGSIMKAVEITEILFHSKGSAHKAFSFFCPQITSFLKKRHIVHKKSQIIQRRTDHGISLGKYQEPQQYVFC